MGQPLSGYDKFKQTGAKLKRQVPVEAKKPVETTAEAAEKIFTPTSLAVVQKNEALVQMYRESAKMGTDNLGGTLPLLKVHTQGRSHTNELADGSEPADGAFFYSEDSTQYDEVICHVLSVSRGFRAPGMGEQENKQIFNQILGGVLVNDGAAKPFLMFFTGKKLSQLWEFGKEVRKFTKNKEMPIPLFALTVKLLTHQEKNSYGRSWIIDFEVLKNEDGSPQVVTDEGKFVFLKEHVGIIEDSMERLIAAKSGEDRPATIAGEEPPHPADDEASDIPF